MFRYVFLLVVFYVLGILSYSFFASKTSLLIPKRTMDATSASVPGAQGNRLIYPKFAVANVYPGTGETTMDVAEELTVISKETRKSIAVPVENAAQYKEPEYTSIVRKAKKGVVVYAVGYMKGWETIAGTKDRLIVLADPKDQKTEYKYRVAFQNSALFAGNETKFGVQNLTRVGEGKLNHIQIMKKPLLTLSGDELNTVLSAGDVVIMIPVPDLVESVKADPAGYVLADWLYVRRFNGVADFSRELRQLFYEQ